MIAHEQALERLREMQCRLGLGPSATWRDCAKEVLDRVDLLNGGSTTSTGVAGFWLEFGTAEQGKAALRILAAALEGE